MENQIGLNSIELEGVFAQIKNGKGVDLEKKVFDAYLPLVNKLSQNYGLKKDIVIDIYEDAFAFVYANVLEGIIEAGDFYIAIEKIMTKQCKDRRTSKDKFSSPLLGKAYKKAIIQTQEREEERARSNEFATQSFMFVIEMLNELLHNPELAQVNNLNEQKIHMVMDHLGLNAENKNYTIAEIATKYNVTEKRAQAMLVSALKNIRHIKEFQSIRAGLGVK